MKETSEVVADYAIKPLIVPRTVKTYVNFYVDVGVIDRIKLLILPVRQYQVSSFYTVAFPSPFRCRNGKDSLFTADAFDRNLGEVSVNNTIL